MVLSALVAAMKPCSNSASVFEGVLSDSNLSKGNGKGRVFSQTVNTHFVRLRHTSCCMPKGLKSSSEGVVK